MALSLLNYFVWENAEARGPFMFADCIVLTAMLYIDRGMKAERKSVETEAAQEANQQHEMEKAASRAQDEVARQQKKPNKKGGGPNHGKKHFNIQQPKRD